MAKTIKLRPKLELTGMILHGDYLIISLLLKKQQQ